MLNDKPGTLASDFATPRVRVAQATVMFWSLKLLSTAMGEAVSDSLSRIGMPPYNGGPDADAGHLVITLTPFLGVMAIALLGTMIIQISSRKFVPWKYWLNVVVVAVFGTAAADAVDIGFVLSTLIFGGTLVAVLVAWYLVEKTLSVHSIVSRRREVFYWMTVLATFMLGTALGDMTAQTMKMGTLWSAVMFLVLILIPAVSHRFFRMNEVLAFWIAYILTRPLGASIADWLSYSHGGLSLGSVPVGIVFTLLITIGIGCATYANSSPKLVGSPR